MLLPKGSRYPGLPRRDWDMEVKAWWMINLQRWYVFFYEKNGRKVRGVLGKDRTKDLLRSIL